MKSDLLSSSDRTGCPVQIGFAVQSTPDFAMSSKDISSVKIFDGHMHIIDERFPLIPNNGFLPEAFNAEDYLAATSTFNLIGGAVVSGSFQGFDQTYLIDSLKRLGGNFVGVTQLPITTSDKEILQLNELGVRAVRFNLKRGGSENVRHLEEMAAKVYDLAKWHVELYVEASELKTLKGRLEKLPAVSIDHLGLTREGFGELLYLVERGARVKATGFGRVDFDVKQALKDIYAANTDALIFGTDRPSTRAPRPYSDDDIRVVIDALGDNYHKVFVENALSLYNPTRVNRTEA